MSASGLPTSFAVRREEFAGDFTYILRLPAVPQPEDLRRLIAGNQFATSADGHHFCMVVPSGETSQQLVHSVIDLSFAQFSLVEPNMQGLRILQVHEDHVVIWGRYEDEIGVFRVDAHSVFFQHELHELASLRWTPDGLMPIGRNEGDLDGTSVALTRHGPLHLERGAIVNVQHNGDLLILERIGDGHYFYRMGDDAFMDWTPVSVLPGEVPIDVLCQEDGYMIVLRRPSSSVIRPIATRPIGQIITAYETVYRGHIVNAWASPALTSNVTLIHDPSHKLPMRLCVDKHVIYAGTFTMRSQDLRWSPDGTQFGVLITEETKGAAPQQKLVTFAETVDIPEGRTVRDFLVDDSGQIASTILDDGRCHRPSVYTRDHDPVPLCWNLRWNPDGSVGHNSVSHDLVVKTVDCTDQQRR